MFQLYQITRNPWWNLSPSLAACVCGALGGSRAMARSWNRTDTPRLPGVALTSVCFWKIWFKQISGNLMTFNLVGEQMAGIWKILEDLFSKNFAACLFHMQGSLFPNRWPQHSHVARVSKVRFWRICCQLSQSLFWVFQDVSVGH